MSPDSVTEVTSQSWGSRLGGAVKGVLIGLLLFVVSFPVLFLNEGRSVKTYKKLKEGSGAVIEVAADKVDAANEGALIHISGAAVTDDVLTDDVFGISANALSLFRQVEMYQWIESKSSSTKKKVGGSTETTTTYKYSKGWSDSVEDSSSFHEPAGHQNPGAMPYEASSWQAGDVKVGDFSLTSSQIGRIGGKSALPVGATALPAGLAGKASIYNNMFYVGANPAAPAVGDLKVSYSVVKPTDVSVIAAQSGKSFKPYKAKVGGTIDRLQTGIHDAAAMFEKAQAENKALTWGLRLLGFILMVVGLGMALRPMSVLADVLPFLGSIVSAGAGLISLLISLMLSTVTIGVAWIVYRPVLGIILFVVAGGAAAIAVTKVKGAKAADQVEA